MEGQPKIYRSNITSVEWIIIFVLYAIIDAVQFFLVETVLGGTIIDILAGASLVLWLVLRGEFRNPQTRNRILLALVATFAVEAIPILNVAPFWFLDVWFCWSQSKKTNQLAESQEQAEQQLNKKMQLEMQQKKWLQLQAIRQRQAEQESEGELVQR